MIVTPNKKPGHYPASFQLKMTGASLIDTVALSKNAAPPANSKYIGYDESTPPKPFLAVTQDGKGNVVYDGGFPKFYNSKADPEGTTFYGLKPQFRFLWNAVNFIANPAKVAAGNKKVLLLGDRTANNYWVKSEISSGFKITFTRVIEAMGFTLTIMDAADWGGKIDITLNDLEQYCCVIFMSSNHGTYPMITTAAINNLVTYRQNGNGLFFITDHGQIVNNLDTASNGTYTGFFRTANAVTVNFGAWFSDTVNRTPVAVGFLRSNYGDHPLYNGLSDNDTIDMGGSESEVILSTNATYSGDAIPDLNVNTDGVNVVNVLAVSKDGEVSTERFLYTVGNTPLVSIVTPNGVVPVNGTIETYKRYVDFNLISNYPELGTLVGEIYIDDVYLGTVNINGNQSDYTWITDPLIPNISGENLRVSIVQPYSYDMEWTITRRDFNFSDGRNRENLFDTDFNKGRGLNLIRNINKHLTESVRPNYRPDTASVLDDLEGYEQGIVDYGEVEVYLVGDFMEIFNNRTFSPVDKTIAVNVVTREVYLPTDKGWVLSAKSVGDLLGVGRLLRDKETNNTYLTSDAPKTNTTHPDNYPLYDGDPDYGFCSVVTTIANAWWRPTDVPSAKYIWDRSDVRLAPGGEVVKLRKWFYSPYKGTATLVFTDDDQSTVFINGVQYVGEYPNHAVSQTVTISVRSGMNLIHVEGRNGNPGYAMWIGYILDKDGKILTKTDSSWLKYSIPNLDGNSITVKDVDDVTIPFNKNMVLNSEDKIVYTIDFKSSGPSGGAILGIHYSYDSSNVTHRGLDIYSSSSSSAISVHLIDHWLTSGNAKSLRFITDVNDPNFIDVWDGLWHTLKVEYDGSKGPNSIKFYVDGNLQKFLTAADDPRVSNQSLLQAGQLSSDGAPIRIGGRSRPTGASYYPVKEGSYRLLAIWRNDELIGYWPMHRVENDIIYDYGKYSVHSNPIVRGT